jgi:membrane fusion protein (multidrug efflux system)
METAMEIGTARTTARPELEPARRPRNVEAARVEEPQADEPRRPLYRRPLWLAIGLLAVLTGVGLGVRYYLHARAYEVTDDAFVDGRLIQMSPRVAGHVAHVLVTDNQRVEAGQTLVEIDPRDFQTRVDQAKAALESARGKAAAAKAQLDLVKVTSGANVSQAQAAERQAASAVESANAQVTAARSALTEAEARVAASAAAVDQAKAEVVVAEAERVRAGLELKRFEQMHASQVASDQELANAQAAARTADARTDAANKKVTASQAAVSQAKAAQASAAAALTQAQSLVVGAQAKLEEAKAHVEEVSVAPQRVRVAEADVNTAGAEVQRLDAQLHQAELDLSYTKITAPEAGRVTRKAVEDGNYVQPGQAMFALVPEDMWVVANFKETQLDLMRPGQPVDVKVDAYPGLTVPAHVDSVQRGTGARFSLLPPENATGNYVKVVQRVPVKIVFDQMPSNDRYPIGPGMSVEPEVKVR